MCVQFNAFDSTTATSCCSALFNMNKMCVKNITHKWSKQAIIVITECNLVYCLVP